ncbi:ankyrin repeat-containing [Fusarium sporotrichioides]|uniref:Ankyrin repeat-containing n=1 Tax=Fusarium sporotrichioides TaxID=5514 RepID=A0A395RTL2_FUSSP|nr:ankyrin repeat-containing [Fusarium sporotrichioides]
MASDESLDQGFEIVTRDLVPAPAFKPNDSPQKLIADLREWLQPTDFLSPGNDFTKHLRSYAPGTSRWFRNSPYLRAWATVNADPEASPSCLHVCGVAGSGKSVLAANTINWLQKSGNVVLFFFFRQIVAKNHTAKYLVRDFAAQLLPHCPALVTLLVELSQNHAINDCEMDLVWPAVTKVLVEEEFGDQVFVVVDALDEMNDAEFDDMTQRLITLGTAKPEKMRVMMTSRPLPKIVQALANSHTRQLKLDLALLSSDVARYVNDTVATIKPPISNERKELVMHTICDRAGGLFLHARLILDSLIEGLQDGSITNESLPDSLDRLPQALRGVYDRALAEHARRSNVTMEQQVKILTCVTHASRPLRLIELGSLLSSMLKLDLRQGKDLARAACGRLLEVLEDESVTVIHHSFTEFLHDVSRGADPAGFPVLDSAKSHSMLAVLSLEYLDTCPHFDMAVDDGTEAGKDFGSYFKNHAYHSSESARRDRARTEVRMSHPLVEYAAGNFSYHLEKAAATGPTSKLLAALDHYFVPGKPAMENWALFMGWEGRLSASVNIFHLAAAIRDHKSLPIFALERFANRWSDLIDAPDLDGRTPLSYAAENGQVSIASILLSRGANASAFSKNGMTPLHWAARRGHLGVVQLLLDAGADPRAGRGPILRGYDKDCMIGENSEARSKTALDYAFPDGDFGVLQAFMPFVPPDKFHQFFHSAIDTEIVEAFLDTGKVDVDSVWEGETKLYQAAAGCWPEMVDALLKRGADPTKRCWPDSSKIRRDEHVCYERGPTPLHGLAVQRSMYHLSRGDKKHAQHVIWALVHAGADINATVDGWKGATGATPLHFALEDNRGHWAPRISDKSTEVLTELFLSLGADPNAKTKEGNAPIHVIDARRVCLLEMLVNQGAEINCRNSLGRTPLLEILDRLGPHTIDLSDQSLCLVTLNKLLDLGAEPNAVDHNGDTTFHHILRCLRNLSGPESDFLALVERLALAGVDLSKANSKGQPPLLQYNVDRDSYWGVSCDDEKILRALMNFGMNVNAKDEEGRNILWVITEFKYENLDVLKKFMRLGANPHESSSDGRTLLHDSVKHERSKVWIRFLVAQGVDPTTTGHDGNTLIHDLLREAGRTYSFNWYAEKILPVLVEIGAPPLAINAKGQTALHLAKELSILAYIVTAPSFQGLDINQPDVDGFTPLHHAIGLGDVATSVLVKFGANPAALTATGLSPIHIAARQGEAGALVMLLAKCKERGVLDRQVNMLGEGRAPLHYACLSGSPESVWALLSNGADPRLQDDMGLTPLHCMAESGDLTCKATLPEAPPHAAEIITMLQRAGIDLSAETTIRSEDTGAIKRLSPLDMAVERRSWVMIRELLARGVEPQDGHDLSKDFILATDKDMLVEHARMLQEEATDDEKIPVSDRHWRGRWAFGTSSTKQQTRFILGGQTILNAQAESEDGEPLLFDILSAALKDGDYDSVKEYVRLGGDILAPGRGRDENYTFLHRLIDWGCAELLEHLSGASIELEARVRKHHGDRSYGTLLGTACDRSLPSLHIIQMLVERIGIDINVKYDRGGFCYQARGGTPVHILALGKNWWQIEALRYVLAKGADIEARNDTGMTPLMAAVYETYPSNHGHWNEEAVRVLLEHGANPNATIMVRTKNGTSEAGLSIIEMCRDPGIVKLLLEYGARVKRLPGLMSRAVKKAMEPKTAKLLLDAGCDPNELAHSDRQSDETQTIEGSGETVHQPNNGEEGMEEREEEYIRRQLHRNLGAHERFENPRYALHEAARPTELISPPAHYEQQQRDMIELLICNGADPWAVYPDGSLVLQSIIEDRGLACPIIPHCTKEETNRKGRDGRTLLTSACVPLCRAGYHYGDERPRTAMTDTIHALLKHGANPLITDDEGRTPLHWLCTLDTEFDEAHRKAFDTLVKQGPEAVYMADSNGRKPIHVALDKYKTGFQKSAFAIHHLLAAGAKVTEHDPLTSDSVLHMIAPRLVGERSAATEAAALFREISTTVDINTRNMSKETPVLSFLASGWKGNSVEYERGEDVFHDTVLAMFSNLGADLMTVDVKGRTLLHVVADPKISQTGVNWDQDAKASFKILMECGVDPYREDKQLRTAINVVVARELRSVLELFTDKNKSGEDEEELE